MLRCRAITLALCLVSGMAVAQTRPADPAPAGAWVGAWASSQQAVYPTIAPPAPGLANATLRQIVRLSIGGRTIRVRIANDFGRSTLVVPAVHVAVSAGGAAIQPGTDRPVLFDGQPSVSVPAGAAYWSDPVAIDVPARGGVAVTMRLDSVDAANITEHPGARCTSYSVPGDAISATDLPNAITSEHWYFLSGIDVQAADHAAAVVALGDSITDGRGSTPNHNGRWTDGLVRRLQSSEKTRHIAVLNSGIGGNRVLNDGLGPGALARFDRDVLAASGAKWLIVLEGVNDLGTAKPEAADATADRLIGAYRQMIERAHARGMKVFGGTMPPFGGSQYDAPQREAARGRINAFVRSGAFDGVVDFDNALRDPKQPTTLKHDLETGDHLHPNDAGYRAMADAVDLAWFAR